MKKLIPVFLIAALTIYLLHIPEKEVKKTVKATEKITISFVGDLMCHGPQYEYARCGVDSFDFRPVFTEVRQLFAQSDFVIGNLETVILGKGSRLGSYPLFNSPVEYLDALKFAGFNILITSNNHSLDRGISGIEKTISNLDKIGINHVGTYKSHFDRDSIRIFSKNEVKFALLSYTYGVNGNFIPKEKSYSINLIDTTLIRKDILTARSKNVDAVFVYFHFGEEYQQVPNKFQRELVTNTFSYGADIVIASHPHVIQSIEFLHSPTSKIDQSFVAYSLGNFVSNQRWRYSDCGVILNFTIAKEKEKIILDSLWITPTWVFKGSIAGKNEFIILPDDTTVNKSFRNYLSKSEKDKMYQSFIDTKEIMNAHLK